MEELYDYLITELELNGNLKLNKDYIQYYRYDLSSNITGFYNECIDDKNSITNKLPNGFRLDHFNYGHDELSFRIIKQIH